MEARHSDNPARVAVEADAGLTAGYDVGIFFDEMFVRTGEPRPHYRALNERLAALTPPSFEERLRVANSFFLTQGIGFTVYGGSPLGIPSPRPCRRMRTLVRTSSPRCSARAARSTRT